MMAMSLARMFKLLTWQLSAWASHLYLKEKGMTEGIPPCPEINHNNTKDGGFTRCVGSVYS